MKKLRLFKTANDKVTIAVVGKCGSSALSRALIRDVFQEEAAEQEEENAGVVHVEGRTTIIADPAPPQLAVAEADPLGRILVPVRDPIERFRSGCAQMRLTPDEVLDDIEAGGRLLDNYHFRPVSRFFRLAGCEAWPFPEMFDQMCAEGGVGKPDRINETEGSDRVKPELSDDHVRRLRAIYADDFKARESCLGGPVAFINGTQEVRP